jgi:hypothetical protein
VLTIPSQTAFGVTTAGEFSGGFNDCGKFFVNDYGGSRLTSFASPGLYLRGIPGSHTFSGDCTVWQDASTWTDAQKAGVQAFIMASMDALGDWFFWTWKVCIRMAPPSQLTQELYRLAIPLPRLAHHRPYGLTNWAFNLGTSRRTHARLLADASHSE